MDDFNMGMWPECSFKWYKYYHYVQKRVSKCEKTVGVLQNGTHLKKTVTIWTTCFVWTNELIQHVSSFYENKADLHLHDALREVGWYFSQTFTTAVHYVVVAGAAGWTHCYLRNTSPRFCLCWTCRRQYTRLWNHHTHTQVDWLFWKQAHFQWSASKDKEVSGYPFMPAGSLCSHIKFHNQV